MKKLAFALVLALGLSAPAFAAGSFNQSFTVSATLTSQCMNTTASAQSVTFAYTAFAGSTVNSTGNAAITFKCTLGLTPTFLITDSAANTSAVTTGSVAGLDYSLSGSSSGPSGGTPQAGNLYTYTISGTMDPNQAGDTAASTSQTRYLVVSF